MPAFLPALRPRIGRADLVFWLLVTVLAVLQGWDNHHNGWQNLPADGGPILVSAWAVPTFVLLSLPLLWRSTAPVQALAASLAVLAFQAVAFAPMVRCGTAFPLAAILSYAIGARTTGWHQRVGVGVIVATVCFVGATDVPGFGVVVVGLPLCLVAFGIGRLAAGRTLMAVALEEQTATLQAARDERARLEVATDRAELSGELDALLQRRLRTLAGLADGAGEGLTPAAATARLAHIEAESRATLDEMRELVGALRGTDGALVTSPVPTLTSLEALVVRTRGPRSQVVVEGDPRVLPPGVELSAYRIVEHLLAALDDAPGVEVLVRFEADQLELRVHGQPRRRADLTGSLAKARARAGLHDGTVSSSISGARVVATATLPMLAGA
ncbi:MAG: hypothetical protein J7513_08920 [Solirubrobacteraceae bacterium]|nr:hypothetical protein [Solirubrobacteraceae bacterium]